MIPTCIRIGLVNDGDKISLYKLIIADDLSDDFWGKGNGFAFHQQKRIEGMRGVQVFAEHNQVCSALWRGCIAINMGKLVDADLDGDGANGILELVCHFMYESLPD